MKQILKNIEEIRKSKGYSHEYVASMLNISQVAYSKIESNKTKLTVERLYSISDILEVSVSKILGISTKNELIQTNRDSSTGYLQQIDNFYQESKEQNTKIIELYEERLKDKDIIIDQLQKLINATKHSSNP
ncbi:helix-turn-helix domain-containing protein [Flavobacterium sp.]|uniref:helix-turn-helix domain-containing protein n=1 Tax=Flavobacterium sp. TaxID=239 RepID=UPI003F6964E0